MTLSNIRGPSPASESVQPPEHDKQTRMLEAQYAITKLLARPAGLEDSGSELVQALCKGTGSVLGVLWRVDAKTKAIRFAAGWSGSISDAELSKQLRDLEVDPEVGPAGRAWCARETIVAEDLANEPTWRSQPFTKRAGLRSSTALPLLDGRDVVAVVELFRARPGDFDPEDKAYLLSITSQITQHCERERTVEELRKSRERFELAMMGSGDGIWDWDVLTNEVYFSSNWKSCLGYAEDEIASSFDEWEKRIHPDDRERALATIRAYFRGETPSYTLEHRLQHKDGSYRLILARGVALRDAQGRPYRMSGSHTDITQLKADQIALGDSEALYHSLVETLPLNVLRKDRQGRFTFGNQLFCKTIGKPLAEIVGKTDYDLYPRKLADKYRQDDQRVIEERVVLDAIEEHRKPSGEMIYVEVFKTPVYDARGKVVGTQAFFWDVSERKRAEQEMRRAKDEAESASRSKSSFLANMSHEIRTPMNAIIGMTELMLGTQLTAEQREYLDLVHKSAESLLAVINDILDFSKVEAGKLELDVVEFGLRETLGDLLNTLAPRAHQKGLELACHVAPDTPNLLLGDPGRLGQILLNLVGNAIKFTDQGEVNVNVGLATENEGIQSIGEGGKALLEFAVSDTGIGVPQEKANVIFEAFAQADGSTTRRYGGTGLGLAIAKRLVDLLGGQISVKSGSGGRAG
jgi:PAS domain S-box-containing protein